LVLVPRVQDSASALTLKGPGLRLGLEGPGLGLGLEGPGLGLVLGLWILELNTTLLHRSIGLGWVEIFKFQLGWVSHSMGWVELGHIKWTHGQL